MNTKHGVLHYPQQFAPLYLTTFDGAMWHNKPLADPRYTFTDVADLALEHRITHLWEIADPESYLSEKSHGEYSIKVLERHKRIATTSVWKRGSGHVDIIIPSHTAWNEGTEAFKGVDAKGLLGAITYLERALGITITGSPGGIGWELLKTLRPEWIENIPVNLRELHFTAKAGGDLIWQHELLKQGLGLPRPGRYLHKFDKRSAYPAAATQTDIGKGTPVHLDGEAAARAAVHEKGHPQEVGVWRCTIEYDPLQYDSNMPPVWREDKGTYEGTEGWIAGPIIRMLRAFGHRVTVHEGYVFPERHDLLVKWGTLLWNARQSFMGDTGEPWRNASYAAIAGKATKQIANSTIGFTAFKGFEEDEEEKRRPDIRLQVVSRNREIIRHNIDKVARLQHDKPVMVYMDAIYYLSDAQDGATAFPVLMGCGGKFGYKYEGRIEVTPDVQAMFSRGMSVADRLEFLNKKGWVK